MNHNRAVDVFSFEMWPKTVLSFISIVLIFVFPR